MPTPTAQTSEPDEVAELRRLLAAAEERTLADWMKAVVTSSAGSMTVKQMQQSMSWRVTRPLRAVRLVAGRASEIGVRKTAVLVRERLAQLRQAKKRG